MADIGLTENGIDRIRGDYPRAYDLPLER